MGAGTIHLSRMFGLRCKSTTAKESRFQVVSWPVNIKNNTKDIIINLSSLIITELTSKLTCIIYRVLLTCHVEGEEVIN